MNLEYFYIIKSAEGFIENQGFNFSKNYDFECIINDKKIDIKLNKKLSSNMFSYGSNIYNISAIVGTNGSGKSSVMRELITPGRDTLYIFSEKKEGKIDFYFEIKNADAYEIYMIDSEEKTEIPKLPAGKTNFFFYSNDMFSKKTAVEGSLLRKDENDPVINIINHSVRTILDRMRSIETTCQININRVNYSTMLSNVVEKIEIIEELLRLNFLSSMKEGSFSRLFKNEIYAVENLYIKIIIDYEFLTPNIKHFMRKQRDKDTVNSKNDVKDKAESDDEYKYVCEIITKISNCKSSIKTKISDYELNNIKDYKKYIKTKILFSYYIKKIDRCLDDLKTNEKTLLDYSKNIDELNKLNFDDICGYIYEWNEDDSSKLNKLDEIVDNIEFKIAENKEFYCNLNANSKNIRNLLNYLAELDIYSVFKFDLLNEDGIIIDESSGEKSFMNLLASINYIIDPLDGLKNIKHINLKCLNNIVKKKENKNNNNGESIVFILDEPDTSMHPEWVRKFINFLTMFVNEFFVGIDCQIILTSNNPIMLSDLTKDNIIYLEKGQVKDKSKSSQTFGQNIHTIMKNNFFMRNTYGDYVINYINNISDYIKSMNNIPSSNDYNSEKNIEIFNEKFRKYGVHIEKCEEIYNELERLISFIGEDILRNYLKKMLLKIIPNNERIKLLEEELKKLRGEND